jgi:hypothetical protein
MIFTNLNRLFTRQSRVPRPFASIVLLSVTFSPPLAESATTLEGSPLALYDDCTQDAEHLKLAANFNWSSVFSRFETRFKYGASYIGDRP